MEKGWNIEKKHYHKVCLSTVDWGYLRHFRWFRASGKFWNPTKYSSRWATIQSELWHTTLYFLDISKRFLFNFDWIKCFIGFQRYLLSFSMNVMGLLNSNKCGMWRGCRDSWVKCLSKDELREKVRVLRSVNTVYLRPAKVSYDTIHG